MDPTLPERFWEKVGTFGESSYGAKIVSFVLTDGTQVRNVHLAWGRSILLAKSGLPADFDPSQVVEVESEA
jgi:hypothetical protein